MKNIDFETLAAWCESSGYRLEDWLPSLPSATRHMEFLLPANVQDLPQLLDGLVNLGRTGDELLVWVRDWTIWNDRSQEIGLRHWDLLVDFIRPSVSEKRSHAYLLQESEWRDAIALLTVPALYGWDAHLLFRSAAALVSLSHDGFLSVSLQSGLGEYLESWLKEPGERTGAGGRSGGYEHGG